MDVQFVDRILICSDCHGEFVFTAGEQLFFHDKQFKNDPKRCKPCKSRRSGLSAAANGAGPAAAGLSRTETRTECSECGVQTTVPFKPTQGRPVLCRQCFQAKNKAAAAAPLAASPEVAAAIAASPVLAPSDKAAIALTSASAGANGEILSADAAVLAAASMASASPHSSVASAADLAAISEMQPSDTQPDAPRPAAAQIPGELLAAQADRPAELLAAAAAAPEASKV
jgi:CxxC-x17-CxxC domain-containing protein